MFPVVLQPIISPLSLAFYTVFALIGIFPEIQEEEKRLNHHLRYDNHNKIATGTTSVGGDSPLLMNHMRQDILQERRRAKAMKLLDEKMAELKSNMTSSGTYASVANAGTAISTAATSGINDDSKV